MSRSYKKNPFVTDSKRGRNKKNKRLANHSFRHKIKYSEELPSLSHHKKITESWNICDYRWRITKEDAIKMYNEQTNNDWFKKKYPTLEIYLHKNWERYCRRK